jgi:hypothetical protein
MILYMVVEGLLHRDLVRDACQETKRHLRLGLSDPNFRKPSQFTTVTFQSLSQHSSCS